MKFGNSRISILSKQNVNGISQLVEVQSEEFTHGETIPISFIFQPFQDRIELWSNRQMLYSGNFTSNLVTDLNFESNNSLNNNQLIIDNLCYTEWKQDVITTEYAPVCVNGKEYSNQKHAHRDGYVKEFSFGPCDFPSCPNLINIANNATNVAVTTQLDWEMCIRDSIVKI